MSLVVVATNVVASVFKGDSRAEKYPPALRAPSLLVSFMTEAELERWTLQAKWGPEGIIRFRTNKTFRVGVPRSQCSGLTGLRRSPAAVLKEPGQLIPLTRRLFATKSLMSRGKMA